MRVVGLVLLTWAHAAADAVGVLVLAVITATVILLYRQAFLRYLSVILLTVGFLTGMGTLAWFTTANIAPWDLAIGLLKWASMSTVSLTLFSSLNALELIVALKWLRVPLRIALALGVSLRFFPVLIEQGQRIITIQRLRVSGVRTSGRRFKQMGRILYGVIPALFVSVLRQVENISLSILIQDIESRVVDYRLGLVGFRDVPLLFMLNAMPAFIVLYS